MDNTLQKLNIIFTGIIIIGVLLIHLYLHHIVNKEKSSDKSKPIQNPTVKVTYYLSIVILIITGIILIYLVHNIFSLEGKWRWMNREMIISSLLTIICGIMGFAGSVLGVIGAFMLFNHQLQYNKKQESKLSKNIIKDLLIVTVDETSSIVDFMIDIYISYYITGYTVSEQLKDYKLLKAKVKNDDVNIEDHDKIQFRPKYKKQTFAYMLEWMSLRGVSDLMYYENELLKGDLDILHFPRALTGISVAQDIVNEYYELNKINNILYYDNWNECIHTIQNMDHEKKDNILRWFNLFNKKIQEVDLKKYEQKVEEARDIYMGVIEPSYSEEYIRYIQMDEHEAKRVWNLRDKKLSNILYESIDDVCKFINYRDQAIEILKEDFKYTEFETSTELLNYKFDNIYVESK